MMPGEKYDTQLCEMTFDRVYGDLHVVWTVQGRELPLVDRIRYIVRFVNLLVRL